MVDAGAGYEDYRDFFSVHGQIDTDKDFFPDCKVNTWKGRFPDWQIDTPKRRAHAPVGVLLHVASPRHEVDPVLNNLKHEVIEALLNFGVEQRLRADGFEYEIGRRTSIGQVQKNKTTQVFKVLLSPSQFKPTYTEDIELVHAAVGDDVDKILRCFADRLRARFGL